MAYLILFLAIAVAVLVLLGLRMLIGLNLSFTNHALEQSPIVVPSRTHVAKRR